jgi:hypothetical protein
MPLSLGQTFSLSLDVRRTACAEKKPSDLITFLTAHDGNFLFNFLLALFYRISLKLSCPMDFTNFPMDKQTCAIRMASCKYAQSLSVFFFLFSTHPVRAVQLASSARVAATC